MREVLITVEPFGRQKLKLSGSVVQRPNEIAFRVWAEVLGNPFTPIVVASAADARTFAEAILEICDQLDRAKEKL